MPKIFYGVKNVSFDNYYEALILGCCIGASNYQQKNPYASNDFISEFAPLLAAIAVEKGLIQKMPGDYADFITSRVVMYRQCLAYTRSQTTVGLALSKMGYTLYLAPLSDEGVTNSPEVMRLTEDRVVEFLNSISATVDAIVSKKS